MVKAVIPAAGFGTQFLPGTKSQPKEMMPVLDRPTIQHVGEEAVEAGINDILNIIGRGKQATERHFDKSCELEQGLKEVGKIDRFNRVQKTVDFSDIHLGRQSECNGLGDAGLNAKKHESSVLPLELITWEDVSKYGITEATESPVDGESFRGADFIENPARDDASSNLAITGRYVFSPKIFDQLEQTDLGVGDELQLTDAIRKLDAVRGVDLSGNRYDIWNLPSWLQANIEMALHRNERGMNDAAEAVDQEYVQ